MAEIHALLYISDRPLCTDDVMQLLQVSRGNASMNLRQLLNWGLVRRIHRLGDRKDYFAAETDVWQMFQTIIRERRRREVEPILETIDRCRQMVDSELRGARAAERAAIDTYCQRLDELRGFLQMMNALLNGVLDVGSGGVKRALTALHKLRS
jgi:DNA-binding transcriptional regulator GbsR (MarR family)